MGAVNQDFRSLSMTECSQVVSYARQQMEKYTQWYGAPKFTSFEALVCDIIRRHEIALLKAEIVNPDIAPITLTLE
jgi:hypothetical protein